MTCKLILTGILLSISSYVVSAQTSTDTLSLIKKHSRRTSKRVFTKNNSEDKAYAPDAGHSPRTAVIRSLLIPGSGQVYNNDFWKAPIIYTGIGLLTSAAISNHKNYSRFLALAKIARTGNIPVSPSDPNYRSYKKYSADYQLYVVQNNYNATTLADIASNSQRNVQLSILGIAAVWGVNVIDAYIQAKFIHSYSIDDNLSIKITPGFASPLYFANNTTAAYPQSLKIIFSYK